MKCNICDENIKTCDECGDKFHKGDTVFCDEEYLNIEHKCDKCYIPAEEGEVE